MPAPAVIRAGQVAWKHRPKISLSSQVTSTLLAVGTATGVFLGMRAVIRNFKEDLRAHQALDEGNPAAFALQLKLAFENDNYFGWGTDEEAVFATLEAIPDSRTMNKVQRAYRDLYNRNLAVDLKEELDTEEFATALEIIHSKS